MLEHEGLIADLTRKLYKHTPLYSFGDLMQVGWVSAFRLAKSFDPNRAKISTFLTICIRRDMIRFMNSEKKKGSVLRPAKTEYVPDKLPEILDGLNPEDRAIITMLYYGETKRAVMKRFKLSKIDLNARLLEIGNIIYA